MPEAAQVPGKFAADLEFACDGEGFKSLPVHPFRRAEPRRKFMRHAAGIDDKVVAQRSARLERIDAAPKFRWGDVLRAGASPNPQFVKPGIIRNGGG